MSHLHLCERQISAPIRKEVSIRSCSASKKVPNEGTGKIKENNISEKAKDELLHQCAEGFPKASGICEVTALIIADGFF